MLTHYFSLQEVIKQRASGTKHSRNEGGCGRGYGCASGRGRGCGKPGVDYATLDYIILVVDTDLKACTMAIAIGLFKSKDKGVINLLCQFLDGLFFNLLEVETLDKQLLSPSSSHGARPWWTSTLSTSVHGG